MAYVLAVTSAVLLGLVFLETVIIACQRIDITRLKKDKEVLESNEEKLCRNLIAQSSEKQSLRLENDSLKTELEETKAKLDQAIESNADLVGDNCALRQKIELLSKKPIAKKHASNRKRKKPCRKQIEE